VRYRTIVADPPWHFTAPADFMTNKARTKKDGTRARATGNLSYETLSDDQIAALSVSSLADSNAHLYLWTTNVKMVVAHRIAEAWGFRPKTILTWGKVHRADHSRPSMKTGHYFRGATEHVVFAVRGSLRTTGTWPTLYLWPRIGVHSQKPESFYDLVEQVSPGPYLELFARRQRLGWDVWGNEVLSTVELSA